ncbi:MAG: hypothetical protein NC191_01955 [Muribaculaceae bacterium]|nr:hypothetical protein [Muribaculaceae bacterium]
MIKPLSIAEDARLFTQLVGGQKKACQEIQNLKNLGLEQKDVLIRTIAQNTDPSNPELTEAFSTMLKLLTEGKFSEAIQGIKAYLPNEAAMSQTSRGNAIMAKGWKKPIIFPEKGVFKWLGWADKPQELTTRGLWEAAYGEEPGVIFGAVGNSNIKPEQVRGGCALTKKELSAQYEKGIVDFFAPIFKYFKELGVKSDDIGFAFAHSDCGVDKAAREIVETNGLKGIATTPTTYTQYLRPLEELSQSAEFPNGAIVADFPYPTVLTRNVGEIEDYADVYSRLVGKDNPIGIFGGGEHAFVHDTREALIGRNGSQWVPVDIMKDRFGITIPATNENGTITNAARNILEKVNGSPYEKYRYAFENYLPSSALKEDIAQYDPQMAMTTIAHARLQKAGKIPQ